MTETIDAAADWAARIGGDRPILVTGAAGFVGFHVVQRLAAAGLETVGVDNLNAYYDPSLKAARLSVLQSLGGFRFDRADIADRSALERIFSDCKPRFVLHLAAQAGVRHSIDHPHDYASANLVGFLNILEACRAGDVAHLVYASSSSVYGGNKKLPFDIRDSVDHPVSLYAATKKANELMAHSYSHLYDIPATGLRLFTVYGPWGRPDMAYYKFAKAIFEGEPIRIFNHGRMRRDFTYIDDLVEGVVRVLAKPPQPNDGFDRFAPDLATSWAPHRVFNIGNNRSETLMDFVEILEREIGREAIKIFEPMQPGDVEATWADIEALKTHVGFAPDTPLTTGLAQFVSWYRRHRAAPTAGS